ncbi:hypothetical protein [Rhizobium sp. PP-CC-3G-465]|uniref:hypothetical protein n=1 Tax=Rhizobium sp. PP-CC-3G-465 TaxID=2135648 RepID=UPI0010476B2A|nr:hypothetical protein C8J33_101878 [Rhizobium sp. PP-CC-3G-465]
MSRGAGKIQATILSLIENDEDGAWTTTDICEAVYRGANRVEKKHRVAVSRAIRTMKLPETWAIARLERAGSAYMIFNRLSLESTAKKRWQSLFQWCPSLDYFKERYSHQIDKAADEVRSYREYFEADELGRINIEIREDQTALGYMRFSGAAEFARPIIERIQRLTERKNEIEAKLNVSPSPMLPSGNTYSTPKGATA